MLLKRVIVCLDVKNRRVTKGVKFKDNVDVGDVVELAARYCREGADELVFYDIMASAESRPIDLGMVGDAARKVFPPSAWAAASALPPTCAMRFWRGPTRSP